MTQTGEEKLVEALGLFCQAMENAVQVLKQELSKLEKAPIQSPIQSGLTEECFNILKWERGKGEKLGEFEVAHKSSNMVDKWQHAYNVLYANNATLKNHFSPDGFMHYYWLYLEMYSDRIFRKVRV